MEKLYGWTFFYNPFNSVWVACRDEDIIDVRNNYSSDKAIRSSEIPTLISMIIKGNGNLESAKSIVK